MAVRIEVKGTKGTRDMRLSLPDGHNQNMVFDGMGPTFAVDVYDFGSGKTAQNLVAWDDNPETSDAVRETIDHVYEMATGGHITSVHFHGNARLWVTESAFNDLAEAIENLGHDLRTCTYAPDTREMLAGNLSFHALKLSAWSRAYMVKGF